MLTLFIGIQYFGIVVLFVEILYVLQQNRSTLQGLSLAIAMTTLINFVGYLMEIQAGTKELALQAVKFIYLGKPFIALATLLFIMEAYKIKMPALLKYVLGVIHTTICLLVLTCDKHKLFYTKIDFVKSGYFPHLVMGHSFIYNFYMGLVFIYLIVMIWISVQRFRKANTRKEKGLIIHVMGIPVVCFIALISFLSGATKGYDCTVFAYLIGTVLLMVLMIRYNVLDTVAVAKENAIDEFFQGLIVLDPRYRVVYVNQQVIRIFPEFGGEDYSESLKRVQELAREKKRLYLNERVYQIQDRDIIRDDIFYGKMLVVSDITEMHQYTIELEKQTAIAKDANRAKSDFLAKMSHEIRTPINAVLGMNEMILRESRETDIKRYAKDVKNAANTLLELINDILDSSKIESGKLEIIPARYEVRGLLKDITNMVIIKAEDKELSFEMEVAPELPNCQFGDDVRVRQILINILNNAIKYTEQGGVTLRVSGKKDKQKVIMHYEIEDTGIGIKKEDMPKLYAAFERIEESRNRNVEGTGLGMSIVVELLHLMGSKLEVESRYGIGTTFSFDLEQEIMGEEPIGEFFIHDKDENDEYIYNALFKAPDAKILVVDDNDVNRKVFRNLLKRTLVQIKDVDSGKKCLEWVQRERYDMIFMDALMPEMDGIETLKNMQQLVNSKCKDVPVIILTADAVAGAKERYLKKGFQDFLSKPVAGSELEDMVLRYLPEEKILKEQMLKDTLFGMDVTNQVEQKLIKLIEERVQQIDSDMGMCYCGDDAKLYYEIITDFVEDSQIQHLIEFYKQADWKNYQMAIHTMKGILKTIGALTLYEEALRMEQITKEQGENGILHNHDFFVKQYQELVEQVRNCLVDSKE